MADASPASVEGHSRTVLGRGSVYTLATSAPLAANLLVLPLLTRLLLPAEYGLVSVCLVVVQVGAAVAGAGLAAAITRHGIIESSGPDGARGLLRHSVWITALIAGLAALTAPAWAFVVAPTGPVAEVVLAVVAAAGSAAVLNAQAYLRAVDGAWRFVGLAAVGALAGPVVGVALAAMHPTATAYLWGVAGGWVLAAVAGMLAARKDGPARSYPGELAHALRIGLPSVPHQVALMLALGSLVVLAGHRLGLDQGGRLQVALFIGSGPLVLTAAVNNAWAPVIYRASPGDRPRVLAGTTQDVARLASLAAVGVSLLAPLLLTVATPADYDRPALVPVLALTSLSAVPSVLYLANVHLVFASGRSAGLAVVTPVCVAVGATVAWLTMPAAGLAAAALAFVGVYTALAGGVALLRRWIGQPDWPEGVVAVPLLISVVGAVAGALLPAGAWLPRLAGAAVALAATGLVLRHALRR